MITDNDSVRLIFGLKLRSLRQAKGLSYQQLSEVTKLAISYLHDIENGRKYPKADKILTLARALGVDYDYLVSLNGGKKLQPIIDLINSDFINVIPWQTFGLSPASLLELFSNTPDKVTAFISTLIKMSRAYQMSKEHFYNVALRSYQDLNDNYFDDLELDARRFRDQNSLQEVQPIEPGILKDILKRDYQITIDTKKLSSNATLRDIRSYYIPDRKLLHINKLLSLSQEAFLLAREIGYQYLSITDRNYETIVQHSTSFDTLLNNFRASYFAAAVLIPEEQIVEGIRLLSQTASWRGEDWLGLLDKYSVTPEMLLQRLTNILPHHFGIDQLFFYRMTADYPTNRYEVTKELHLSQLHEPYANALNEHYCRRWLAATLMKQIHDQEGKKGKGPVIGVQIAQYWQTQSRYLCITIAKPKDKNSNEMVSVTIGLMIDKQLMQVMRFVNDTNLPTTVVNTTCERCSIADCLERAAEPVVIMKQTKTDEIQRLLKTL